MLDHTVFPRLVTDYVSTYRYRSVEINGRRQKKFLLSHDFLIVSESGAPLSLRSADDVAKAISQGAGVDFNWHLARHAFFNRAYAAVAGADTKEAREAQINDIVFWGAGRTRRASRSTRGERGRRERAVH